MSVIIDPGYQRALEKGEELAEWMRGRDDAAWKREVDLEFQLKRDISTAIASILREYGASGQFGFTIYKPSGGAIEYLKGERVYPRSCYAAGSTTVEHPEDITLI